MNNKPENKNIVLDGLVEGFSSVYVSTAAGIFEGMGYSCGIVEVPSALKDSLVQAKEEVSSSDGLADKTKKSTFHGLKIATSVAIPALMGYMAYKGITYDFDPQLGYLSNMVNGESLFENVPVLKHVTTPIFYTNLWKGLAVTNAISAVNFLRQRPENRRKIFWAYSLKPKLIKEDVNKTL